MKGEHMIEAIRSMTLQINHQADGLITYRPDVHEYWINVPNDCYGILFRLQYNPAYYIRISADRDAGRSGYMDLDRNMGDYVAGDEVPYYDYYGGYVLRLDKRAFSLDQDLDETVTVQASSEEFGNTEYTIHIHRGNTAAIRRRFRYENFHDGEFDLDLPYAIYLPQNYDPSQKYPVVLALHGTGEIRESVDEILRKSAMATLWAEASEYGNHPCIVVVPQCRIRYDEQDNWTTIEQYFQHRTDSPFWPMPQLKAVWKLLENIRSWYSVDEKRMYLTGVSSGGIAAYVLAQDHPGVFAAIAGVCSVMNPWKLEALRGTAIWMFHADDDPMIVPSQTLNPICGMMDQIGLPYRLTRYPEGRIFWRSGHFSWEAAYCDPGLVDWMFSQKHS